MPVVFACKRIFPIPSTSSITWSATGATSCNAVQGYGFTVANGATSGTDTTGALTNSTQNSFTISCTDGTTTETKTVQVSIIGSVTTAPTPKHT